MRTLVHLRHGERQVGGVHLTERGARLAEELGRRLPHFDRVLTSPKPRAVETAEAMGYSVDGELFPLGTLPDEFARTADGRSPETFADYVAIADRVPEAQDHARRLASLLGDELARLANGRRLLVVSHGGVIELGTVGALGPVAGNWGRALGYLEGVELQQEAERWSRGTVLRPLQERSGSKLP